MPRSSSTAIPRSWRAPEPTAPILPASPALTAALDALKPDRIAGAGGLRNRHDAMLAGEAGADYVMFGEPDRLGGRPPLDALVERLEWWAEIFQPPCIGYAASLDEVVAAHASWRRFHRAR